MRAVIDTGPLVALLNRRDQHHLWAKELVADLEPPLYTCEAVISEACFLLKAINDGPEAVLELMQRGAVEIGFDLEDELEPVSTLMRRYRDVPMSFADACLVRMTEIEAQSVVITVDSDFEIYRRNRRQVVPTISPN